MQHLHSSCHWESSHQGCRYQAGPAIQPLFPMSSTSDASETLYCTIYTSRVEESKLKAVQPGAIRSAIEKDIRTKEGYANNLRCVAVMRDPRKTARIRVACRSDDELQRAKQAAEKVVSGGIRVLRDQLFAIKIGNANHIAVLDEHNQLRPVNAETLGSENNVHIAKIAWLSKRDSAKAYGSMVIYVAKGSDASQLLQEQFFHVAGESAYTSKFASRA
jgi:hypothetical protein